MRTVTLLYPAGPDVQAYCAECAPAVGTVLPDGGKAMHSKPLARTDLDWGTDAITCAACEREILPAICPDCCAAVVSRWVEDDTVCLCAEMDAEEVSR